MKGKDLIEQFIDALKPGSDAQEQQLPPKMKAVRVLLDAEESHLEALAVRLSELSLDEEFVLLAYRRLDERGKAALRDVLASKHADVPLAAGNPSDQSRRAAHSDLARYMPNILLTGSVQSVADTITIMNMGNGERR